MTKRFFTLLYVLALIAIGLSLPIFLLTSVHWDKAVITSYKAKCFSNDQYVVLQGSKVGEVDVMDETFLSQNAFTLEQQLNFYCKYYDEIQPYIVAYAQATTPAEQYAATASYNKFEDSKGKAFIYPDLYKLEVAGEEKHPEAIYNPLLGWLILAVLAFLLLQVVRMCYVYVVFGKVVWHPFRKVQ